MDKYMNKLIRYEEKCYKKFEYNLEIFFVITDKSVQVGH